MTCVCRRPHDSTSDGKGRLVSPQKSNTHGSEAEAATCPEKGVKTPSQNGAREDLFHASDIKSS